MTKPNDRRDFLKLSALAGGVFLVPSCSTAVRTYAANSKLSIGVIGAGGKGSRDARGCESEDLVALCDVDTRRAAGTFKRYPMAIQYSDYRVMLDRQKLDAVVISTPDHSHAPAAVRAMEMGLHIYCQKPLTHTIAEARLLRDLARKHGVATSMGNQGTGMDGFRSGVESVRAGVIGKVREVHVWTNRPGGYWKQGLKRNDRVEAIPPHLRWDLWLGPAPHRVYRKGYAPFAWRGFWDFGTGALGDMGCHIMNLPFMALRLGAPSSVVAQTSGGTDDSAPLWSIVTYDFPARGALPPVTLTWYDGGKKPPAELVHGMKLRPGGSIMVGDRGTAYSSDDYGAKFALLPENRFTGYKPPPPSLPRAPGKDQQAKIYLEWIEHCKGGRKCLANFDYAAALTETVLLGNVAVRTGERIEWDSENLKATNCAAADQYIRKDYSYGFGVG